MIVIPAGFSSAVVQGISYNHWLLQYGTEMTSINTLINDGILSVKAVAKQYQRKPFHLPTKKPGDLSGL
jgi:hypothetical protein